MRYYVIFAACASALWLMLLLTSSVSALDAWPAALTMVFGSFIAGASAEGGGAVAFPVFTLLLKIAPDAARNFSFAIQSFGMVAASMLIIGRRIPVEMRAVYYPALGGIVGLVAGTYSLAPLVDPGLTKLLFVSIWLAFGIALWRANRDTSQTVVPRLPDVLQRRDIVKLVMVGLLGGFVTSLFGNGIDLLTFCMLRLWYGLDEKVATPTSVLLMSILTVAGTFLHAGVMGDFGQTEYTAWLAAAPVVLVFAPLGAHVISKWPRLAIARLLYTIIVVQFVGALYVLGLTIEHVVTAGIAVGATSLLLLRQNR